MTIYKTTDLGRLDRTEINSKSEEWKQAVAREKTESELKIIQGKRKVKWDKKREGQNI